MALIMEESARKEEDIGLLHEENNKIYQQMERVAEEKSREFQQELMEREKSKNELMERERQEFIGMERNLIKANLYIQKLEAELIPQLKEEVAHSQTKNQAIIAQLEH